MRKLFLPLLVIVLLAMSGLSAWLLVQNHDAKLAYQDLSAAEEQSRQNYDRTIDAIAAIQDSLDAITPRDSAFQAVPGSLAAERELAGPSGERALERIATLRASIERSRARIRQLEGELAHAGSRAKSLNRMVANLQRTLSDRQAALDEMAARVEALQNQVGTLQTEVQQGQETLVARDAALEDRRRELATVYYVIGTKSELARKGAVVARGGLLGIGKTLLPGPAMPASDLQALDTDATQVLATGATRAQVITPQPASSYELRVVDGRVELHILDPNEFRKVRQLVIVTA